MLYSLAILFLGGLMLGKVCERIHLPRFIGYLLIGILCGPYLLNVLSESLLTVSSDLREMALLIILMQAGLSLSLSDFKKMGIKAILMSFVPACFEICATFFLSQWLFHLSAKDALLLGAIIASASPAVIVPRMLKLIKEGYGTKKGIPQLILTGDSIDDVFNIVVFSAVLGMQTGESVSAISFLMIPVAILIGIMCGLVIGWGLSVLFARIKEIREIKLLILLSVGFMLYGIESWIDQFFPFSALICIMAAGVTIYHRLPKEAESLTHSLSKLWIVAQVLLFALVGASVDIRTISSAGLLAIGMFVMALLVRSMGIFLCLIGSGFTFKEKCFCMLTGIPKATVQAAIGGIPLAMGFASGPIILAISVVAILFTAPLGAILIDHLDTKLLTHDVDELKEKVHVTPLTSSVVD